MLNLQGGPFFPIQLILVDVVALQPTASFVAATRHGSQNHVYYVERDQGNMHWKQEACKHGKKMGRLNNCEIDSKENWVVGAGLLCAQFD